MREWSLAISSISTLFVFLSEKYSEIPLNMLLTDPEMALETE
jgi:hypothetical protein